MLEKELEKLFIKLVKSAGGKAYKFVSPGNVGVPDRLVVMPGGRLYFVELKRQGQKPRPNQQMQINRLKALGCSVYVVDCEEAIAEFLQAIHRKECV